MYESNLDSQVFDECFFFLKKWLLKLEVNQR